jgi:N-acylneuraminate cytidylyltransferase
MRLAVIPARGGSKRIPHKNIRAFCGKPIIAYSIEAAIQSKLFDKVIVSTDDEAIAAVAKQYGAQVPFVRPPELADDFCGVAAVVEHAIEWCQQQGFTVDAVCTLYATAPLVAVADIVTSFEQLKTDADNVISVASFTSPIQRAFIESEDGELQRLYPEYGMTRSQDLPETYYDAAHFFWWSKNYIDRISTKTKAYIVARERVQDIDTEEDWSMAELLFTVLTERQRCEVG